METSRTIDGDVARLMASQHYVAHRDQLLEIGLSPRAIGYRTSIGRYLRVAPEVYALAPLVHRESWWMAAVLTSGPGAMLSHSSASALHGGDRVADDVTVPGPGVHVITSRRTVRAPFVIVHTHRVHDRDRVVIRGIPTTSIERTIVDLAELRSEHQLADVIHEMTFRFDVHIEYVHRLALARQTGWHHAEVLLGALSLAATGSRGTRSELEDAFLRMLDRAGIRRPRMNVKVRVGSTGSKVYTVDAEWPDVGVVVELDGRRSHGRPRNKRDDRLRDEALRSAGRHVLRLRWIDVHDRAETTVRRLRALVG